MFRKISLLDSIVFKANPCYLVLNKDQNHCTTSLLTVNEYMATRKTEGDFGLVRSTNLY